MSERTKIKPSRADYPTQVCFDCGRSAGRAKAGVCSMWLGVCGICKAEKSVTSARDYGWPVFEVTK